MTTKKPNGVKLIKSLLENLKEIEVKYISAGRYSLKAEAENIKIADNQLKEILKDLEKKAKKLGFEFSIKEK